MVQQRKTATAKSEDIRHETGRINGKLKEYGDILYLERPKSSRHTPMTATGRAAQFLPFAAVTGYDAAVQETARLTETRIELDEQEKAELNTKLCQLTEGKDLPYIVLTYFQPDERKTGGAYVTLSDHLVKLNFNEQWLKLEQGTVILFEDVIALDIPDR